MMQTLILVDDKDHILGHAKRSDCHTGKGKKHRAFVILLYDTNKRILLQKRRHKLWDNFWDLAAASHPLWIDGKNESYIQAATRCLKREWRIDKMDEIRLTKIGAFSYFARYGSHCENEYCALLVGECNGNLEVNSKYTYTSRWITFKELLSEIKESGEVFTPWLKEAVKLLNKGVAKQFS